MADARAPASAAPPGLPVGQIDERTVHRLRDGTSYVSSGLPGADMAAPHGLPQVGGNTPASAGAGTPMPVRGSDATTCATRTFNEGSAPGIAVQFPSLLPGFVPIDGGGQMSGNLLNATNLHAHGAGGAQVAGGDAERGGQDGSAQVLGKILAKLEQVQEQTAFLADQSHAYGIALQRLEAEQRRLAGISSRHGSALGLLAATPRSEKSGTSVEDDVYDLNWDWDLLDYFLSADGPVMKALDQLDQSQSEPRLTFEYSRGGNHSFFSTPWECTEQLRIIVKNPATNVRWERGWEHAEDPLPWGVRTTCIKTVKQGLRLAKELEVTLEPPVSMTSAEKRLAEEKIFRVAEAFHVNLETQPGLMFVSCVSGG